jgi:hypothetical protein
MFAAVVTPTTRNAPAQARGVGHGKPWRSSRLRGPPAVRGAFVAIIDHETGGLWQ